jgi:bifunctional UDP-N-acetylglucosamine pyrophosphorylase/glucosamine-1-phosphate N-acetyltransferase
VANRPLRLWQEQRVVQAGGTVCRSVAEADVAVRGDAWVSVPALSGLMGADRDTVLLAPCGSPLAWRSACPAPPAHPCAALTDPDGFAVCYPWDLLRVNEELVGGLESDLVEGEIAGGVHIEGRVAIGRGSRLLPGVYIEGNAVIGCDCKVGPNCYIRGSTSIGDHCHVGQAVELKNVILMDHVSIGHLSYCGDSIIGAGTNFGAGTITANFRHDGRTHRSMIAGSLVDTGRRKFGTIIGDGVHTGIHTSIYPGRKLWPHTSTRPGDVVQLDLVRGDDP